MKKVFIETTIPSFYFETRKAIRIQASRSSTREWWDRRRMAYALCTSEFVLIELAASPARKAGQAMELMREVEVFPGVPGISLLIEAYVRAKVMPSDAFGDASHLAYATLHRCDYLLTWNCKHLANANKWGHIRKVNARLGFPTPEIITPDILTHDA